LCSKCFRPLVHGNRLHPQQVAFYAATLNLHPATYRSALPSAALRPAGSICAAMLSFSNATARIRCRLLSCSKSAAAFAAFYCQVPHSALRAPLAQHCRTARRQGTPSSPHSRPAVSLASACIRCCQACIRSQLSKKPALSSCLHRQKKSSIAPVLMKIAKEPGAGAQQALCGRSSRLMSTTPAAANRQCLAVPGRRDLA